MATINFKTQDGELISAKAGAGSLMGLACKYKVKGILGDCGGVASCGTCHIHIDPADMDKLPPISDAEKDILEFEDNANEYSRLACQLKIKESLEGITVTVAN